MQYSYLKHWKGALPDVDKGRNAGLSGRDHRAADRQQMEAADQEDGIITRTVYPEVPPRVEYALSALGESMRPIMDAMEAWGNNYKNQG